MASQKQSPITTRPAQEIVAYQDNEPVNISQFLGQATALASRLPNHRYVINLLTDRYQYLLGFCASMIAGQCTLMPANRLATTVEQLSSQYADNYLLEEFDLIRLGENALQDKTNHVLDSQDKPPQVPYDQLCAIAFTSGSTGDPTPNLKYWRTLEAGSKASADFLLRDINGPVSMVGTVPPQHMWGLETSILLPLFANVAISNQTPFYPQDIASALACLPEPRVLVSSPIHLEVLLRSDVALTQISRIFSATAPVSKDLARQLEQTYQTQFLEIFGSSESGILAFRKTASEELWQLSELFKLEPGQGNRCLVVADHLPESFELQDAIECVSPSSFRWLGRHHDMINIAGKRGSLADINRRLLAIDGVLDGIVFAPREDAERLAAMVVAHQLRPDDILNELKSVVESVFLPRPVFMVSGLPRQTTGKLSSKDVLGLYDELRLKSR